VTDLNAGDPDRPETPVFDAGGDNDPLELCTEELELKSLLLEAVHEGIVATTADGRVVFANAPACALLGHDLASIRTMPFWSWMPGDSAASVPDHISALRGRGRVTFQACGRGEDRRVRHTEISAQSIVLPGYGDLYIAVLRDITDRVLAEERIRSLAFHDPLTGLANRVLLDQRLRTSIAEARRHGDIVGVVYLDLDDFKPVNDQLGHAVGDRVLKQVANRLVVNIRDCDTVARLGGDEFLAVFGRLETRASLAGLAERLSQDVAEPLPIGRHLVNVHASVGLAVYEPGEATDELVTRADHAMYHAKQNGLAGWEQFLAEEDRLAASSS
jgi:diguanylate cyclase (GGDEF)-like protein/PAS domain S-box-containing protein